MKIDREPLVCNNSKIDYCDNYMYLGSPFTDAGSPSTAVELHANKNVSCFKICIAYK